MPGMIAGMKVVTAGYAYLDIDAYAGIVSYAELLRLQGETAIAATTAPLNESVSKTVRSWLVELVRDYGPTPEDSYILIDISDPQYFDTFVASDQVSEVIDHHPGFETYWQQRIGKGADIVFIGAACTLVYERWLAAGLLDKMSVTSARLLVCGILDNTLNFGAKVTTDRDKQAYDALLKIADLPKTWTEQYFSECQESITNDTLTALQKDTKTLHPKTYNRPIRAGQLVVWEAKSIMADYAQTMQETLGANGPDWFLNLICVSEGKSYFYSSNKQMQDWLVQLLGVTFEDDIAIADRLWLRKEIIKQDIEADSRSLVTR